MSPNLNRSAPESIQAESTPPAVSVLLPVYNAELYIREAVDSILSQTFTEFELLALDDGSTDKSLAILREYESKDRRVHVFSSRENRGVVSTANELIAKARGHYLARMDADDICLPERLEKQVTFLDSSPGYVAVGGWVEHMNLNSQPIGIIKTPLGHAEIDEAHLKGHCSIWHPSVTMRAAAVASVGGYHNDFSPAEDLELWLRLAEVGNLANLPQVLVRYRLHRSALSERERQMQQDRARRACERAWARRGIKGTFEATHWRPGKDKVSRHHFALRYGWLAWNHNHRCTWWGYTREAIRLRPFTLSTWKLFFFGLIKKPNGRGVKN
jgi:glycosyltransferase involved in cell wall biosynthesis